MSDLTEKVRKICGDTVVADATRWHKTGPRRFVRPDATQKSLGMKISRANDAIFAAQDEDSDTSMREFYEVRAKRYDVFDQLPWVIEAEKVAKREARRKAREEKKQRAAERVSGSG